MTRTVFRDRYDIASIDALGRSPGDASQREPRTELAEQVRQLRAAGGHVNESTSNDWRPDPGRHRQLGVSAC